MTILAGIVILVLVTVGIVTFFRGPWEDPTLPAMIVVTTLILIILTFLPSGRYTYSLHKPDTIARTNYVTRAVYSNVVATSDSAEAYATDPANLWVKASTPLNHYGKPYGGKVVYSLVVLKEEVTNANNQMP